MKDGNRRNYSFKGMKLKFWFRLFAMLDVLFAEKFELTTWSKKGQQKTNTTFSKSEIEAKMNNNDKRSARPPLGLIPKWLHDERIKEERFKELREAIVRYNRAGIKIPIKWIGEHKELAEELSSVKTNINKHATLRRKIYKLLQGVFFIIVGVGAATLAVALIMAVWSCVKQWIASS